jgi:stress response protein SCP2
LTIINVAVMNLGGPKSGTGTEHSVSEIVNKETDELLQQVNETGDFGKPNQVVLKALVRTYSSWSHTILFIAILSSHLNVMGISAC